MNEKILDVKNLSISFKTDSGLVRAVRGVSFDLTRGETLCIVGESGSGKSVTSKAIMGILGANAIVDSGSIIYRGEDLLEISEDEMHRIRGHKIGMIFQDPLSSLNPIVRIGKQITEAMLINGDRLKNMKENLVLNENIAYKNAIAKCNIAVKKEKNIFDLFVIEQNKKLENASDEEKESIKNEISEKKKIRDENIAKLKADLKVKLPPLKEAYENACRKADKEVKTYKEKIDNEFKEYKAQFKERLNKAKEEKVLDKTSELIAEKESRTNEYKEACKKYTDDITKQIYELKVSESAEDKMIELQSLLNAHLANEKEKYNQYLAEYKVRFNRAKKGDAVCDLLDEYKAKEREYISKFKVTKDEAKRKALEVMKEVGIPQPEKRFKQYPFEFSGGMRQRIVIAIALTASPEILICDEPTTALDVTIQAQILELIKKIQKERNLSCIFITHDLGVVANMADRVAVMYAGKIVEYGTSEEIFFDPKHPYTWALLSSIPDVDSKERLEAIPGTPPNMIYPPKGDAFALRSKYAMNIDFEEEPPYFKVSETHYAKTWLLHEDAPKVEMPKIVSERIKNSLKEAKNNKEGK